MKTLKMLSEGGYKNFKREEGGSKKNPNFDPTPQIIERVKLFRGNMEFHSIFASSLTMVQIR